MAQPNFVEKTLPAGLRGTTGPNHGINVADYDGDGDNDFFVGRQGAANWLFRNNGDGTFTEVGATAGIAGPADGQTYAACWGDLDNDGDQDLYVGNRQAPDELYENLGDGTFRNIAISAGIDNIGAPRSINLADVDQDGLLDIYVTNFRLENILYRNLGQLSFRDDTQDRAASDTGISMGSLFLDYDLDGDVDLYLTHDNRQPNILLQNDGTGFFTDVSSSSGTNLGGFGMGVDVGDANNDGWPDLYVTNLHDNFLFINQGDGTFVERGVAAGVNDYGMGWGTLFLDFNNDGWQDVYVVNNSYFSPYANVLYENMAQDTFVNATNIPVEGSPFGGYAAASTDFNRDGKPDLLLTNTGDTGGLQYFENTGSDQHHWLNLKLEGTSSNRDAVGAIVTIETENHRLIQQVVAGSGYASQNSSWLHFGLGQDSVIQQVNIRWPSGEEENYPAITSDQFLLIQENMGVISSTNTGTNLPRLAVYPNPAQANMRVQLPEGIRKMTNLQIINQLGQVCLEQRITPSSIAQETFVPISGLPPGSYQMLIPGYRPEKIIVVR